MLVAVKRVCPLQEFFYVYKAPFLEQLRGYLLSQQHERAQLCLHTHPLPPHRTLLLLLLLLTTGFSRGSVRFPAAGKATPGGCKKTLATPPSPSDLLLWRILLFLPSPGEKWGNRGELRNLEETPGYVNGCGVMGLCGERTGAGERGWWSCVHPECPSSSVRLCPSRGDGKGERPGPGEGSRAGAGAGDLQDVTRPAGNDG